jgi:hypothetical protein
MFTKKRIIIISSFILLGIFGSSGFVRLNNFLEWKIAEEAIATGGYTATMGINESVHIQCVLSEGVCIGTPRCLTLDPANCTAHWDVSGNWAGGTTPVIGGPGGLFLYSNLMTTGVTPSMPLIAGGQSQTLMDLGVLAGVNGCVNCMAKNTPEWKQKLAMLSKLIIAGFRE